MARRTSKRKRRTSRRRVSRRSTRRRSRRPKRNTTASGAYFLHYKTPTGIGKVKRLGRTKAKAGDELKAWRSRTYGKGYRLVKVFKCTGGIVRARKLVANVAAPARRKTSRRRMAPNRRRRSRRSSRRRTSRRRSSRRARRRAA